MKRLALAVLLAALGLALPACAGSGGKHSPPRAASMKARHLLGAAHPQAATSGCVRRVPFYKSRPSRPLLTTTLACAAFGVALPYIPPLAHLFGFRPLPLEYGLSARVGRARDGTEYGTTAGHRAARSRTRAGMRNRKRSYI